MRAFQAVADIWKMKREANDLLDFHQNPAKEIVARFDQESGQAGDIGQITSRSQIVQLGRGLVNPWEIMPIVSRDCRHFRR